MRAILACCLAALLVGCGTTKPGALEAPGRHTIIGWATLASADTFEAVTAPTWTRLAQLRHNAARALRDQKVTLDVAKHILARTDLARKLLDDAAEAAKAGDITQARRHHRYADAALEDGELAIKNNRVAFLGPFTLRTLVDSMGSMTESAMLTYNYRLGVQR